MIDELYIVIFKLICIAGISLLLAMISEICVLIVYMRKIGNHIRKVYVVNNNELESNTMEQLRY